MDYGVEALRYYIWEDEFLSILLVKSKIWFVMDHVIQYPVHTCTHPAAPRSSYNRYDTTTTPDQ